MEAGILDKTWTTISGEKITNMREVLAKVASEGKLIHIGTDSQQNHLATCFVTVIVVLNPGKGGRAYYITDKLPRIKTLRERLLREVYMSTEVALEVNAVVPESTKMEVHIDVNPDVDFRSSDYIKELVGTVVGQGFVCKVKPDAWAAMHVADHVVKHKVIAAMARAA